MQLTVFLIALTAALCTGADALEPWASNTHATDARRTHTEIVTRAEHEYAINHGGTMDGENCRSPIGYAAWHQTWESNRAVRLENIGRTDVVNPWLSNGRNDFRTIEEIVAGAIEPGMTDKEKAIAIWQYQMHHRFHAYCGDNENNDPVKVFNVYGYTLCGNDAICLAGLWRTAGLKVRPARPVGHCVTEVYYGGEWHLLDGDEHCIYLLRDNETIASERDIVHDHDLIKRTHTYGILSGDNRNRDEFSASLFSYEGEGGGERDCIREHSMGMTLRPRESITWRWGHTVPVKYHGKQDIADWGRNAVDRVCNGLWEYRPDLSDDLWRRGAEVTEGIVRHDAGLRAAPETTGLIVWKMRSPYVFVGGNVTVRGQGIKLALSWDGETWQAVGPDLDDLFPPAGPARYEYLLRCQLPAGAHLESIAIVNDLQMAPLSLPGMVIGPNTFTYTDRTEGPRRVRITHEWVERSASRPPAAPPNAAFPRDGDELDGTQLAFQWQTPQDPDGDAIADYHFELSDRPDMKWPLSPNFTKLISRTADKGKARYTLPYPGLLTPGRSYYWRVRARDDRGVWGPWSDTWSFTPHGPAPPVSVRIDHDPQRKVGLLRWRANPIGRRPIKYRVYGSDEKGFTVSDDPYEVNVGNQEHKLATPFPANFVTETSADHLMVIGRGVDLPNANRAYYRVVAIDEQGNRSWSSKYAVAPRPFIYSAPPTKAKVGERYTYQVAAIRSLGDLRCRTIGDSPYNADFWDIEHPQYSLQQNPDWLSIDSETGLISGTPGRPGRSTIVVAATIEDIRTATQEFAIVVER